MKAMCFEDLDCWKLGRDLSREVYALTKSAPFARDFAMIDQIRRAAVSVMTNIAEGFERGSRKDFAKFLYIARGSAGETRSLLYVALDLGYIDREQYQKSRELCIRCSQVIYGMIRHLCAS